MSDPIVYSWSPIVVHWRDFMQITPVLYICVGYAKLFL